MLDDRSLLFSDNMGNGMRGLFEVNYEGALSKARDFRPEVNYCCEYKYRLRENPAFQVVGASPWHLYNRV